MLVGEPDSWILSIVFLNDDSKLARIKVDIPDRPGAIYEVMKALGDESVNVLAGYTNVLVYYERMTCELVVDFRGATMKSSGELHELLKKKFVALGPPFTVTEVAKIDI
jgi:hypothetical protein